MGKKSSFSLRIDIEPSSRSDGREVKPIKVSIQRTANDVHELKRLLSRNLICSDYGALSILSGNQLRERIHKWLSPPDASTNHNIACGIHQRKTPTWFFQGSIFQEWKFTNSSLLWIHGKRSPRPLSNITPCDNSTCIVAGSGKSVFWFVDS